MRMSARNTMLATLLLAQTFVAAGCGDLATTVVAPAGYSPVTRSTAALQVGMVQVCHEGDSTAGFLEVPKAAVAGHLSHGDYVSWLIVEPASALAGDGIHFGRITDALLTARQGRYTRGETTSAKCRITIAAAPGEYIGSFDASSDSSLERFPLIIDVPDITLRGALTMTLDGTGRPTGVSESELEVSSLVPVRPLVSLPNAEAMVLVVGHAGGSVGKGVVVEGFSFQSGRSDDTNGGIGVIGLRARELVIRGNRFEKGLSSAVDLRSSTAVIEKNYARQLGASCGFCLGGGEFIAANNRLLDGGLGGIFVAAALAHMPFSLGAAPVTTVGPDVLPAAGSVTATITNNDVRGHTRLPIGFGVRILAVGPGSSNIPQSSSVSLSNNELVGNTFGLILDAGFPTANTLLKGDLDVILNGNAIAQSCQANLLVGFTRHTGSIGTTVNPFLRNSSYRLTLGTDLLWSEAWFAHPSGFGNDLSVDGVSVGNGIQHSFDQSTCPGLGG